MIMNSEAEQTYHQALVGGGLTPNQAKIYEAIIKHGKVPASRVAQFARVPRTLCYKALQELQEYGLIVREDLPGKVANFFATHPFKLKDFVDNRYQQTKNAKVAIDGVLGKIISDFNTRAGAPGLRVLEGVAGIAELYEDILNEHQTIKLIRSPKDRLHPELGALINTQIEEQKKLSIKTFAITPMESGAEYEIIEKDEERFVNRRMVPKDKLAIPAQVIMYGNKVALTAYEPIIITTIIENFAVRQTFNLIFDYLWELTEQDHNRILATLRKS